jgi:hypothetical protein
MYVNLWEPSYSSKVYIMILHRYTEGMAHKGIQEIVKRPSTSSYMATHMYIHAQHHTIASWRCEKNIFINQVKDQVISQSDIEFTHVYASTQMQSYRYVCVCSCVIANCGPPSNVELFRIQLHLHMFACVAWTPCVVSNCLVLFCRDRAPPKERTCIIIATTSSLD